MPPTIRPICSVVSREKRRKSIQKKKMPPPGFEPGTSRSLIINHTTGPSNIGDEMFSYKD